jgi:hypothetical protein
MRSLKSLAASALLALSLAATIAFPALADVQGGDTFRVVGLAGTQTLPLMAGPARWAGLTANVPFDARNLRATGVRQGRWMQLSYRQSNGYDVTGWADTQFLATDDQGEATLFRVVNVGRRQSVPLMGYNGYGVQARIPGNASMLSAAGPCQDGSCPVRYETRRGSFEGLVNQANLAVVRPIDPGFSVVEERGPGYVPPRTVYSYNQPADDSAEPAFADAPQVDLLPPPRPHRGWFHDPDHRINWLFGN